MKVIPFSKEHMSRTIEIYRASFAEPPWCERFTRTEVKKMFLEMLAWPDVIFLVSLDHENNVTGLIIGFALYRKPEIHKLVPRDMKNAIYHAEVCVDRIARQQGIARTLLRAMYAKAKLLGFTHAVVRTSIDQPIILRMYACFSELAREKVISKKFIDGVEKDIPDLRVILGGNIADLD